MKYLVFCTECVEEEEEEDVAEQENMEIKSLNFNKSLCYLSVLSFQFLGKSSPSLIHVRDES